MPLTRELLGKTTPEVDFEYSWKDTVLYALGVGAKRDELDYLYEGRGPKVLPTFAVVPGFTGWFELLQNSGGDVTQVVHGGEKIRLYKPIPAAGKLRVQSRISGVYDLRRLAYVYVTTDTRDESGALLASAEAQIIFRADGGFGGDAPPKFPKLVDLPKDTAPDFEIKESVSPEQALLYRLSGDVNPLHADPEFARAVGFEQGPILHGLATLGFLARHVAQGALGGDATKIAAVEAQFRKPVWPGDVLVTKGYRVDDKRIAVDMSIEGREGSILAASGVELF